MDNLGYNETMDNIIPENEMTEVEGRVYINPQTGIDTTNAFIENLRQTQQANTAQIADQTQALGTEVPSNLGGLTGGTGYWTSRYQVPQTNAAVANLRAAAQAQALNEVLANEQAIWKKRYQQAYRNYQSRQNAKANASYGGSSSGVSGGVSGGVDYEDTSEPSKTVGGVEPSYSPMGSGDFEYTSNESIFNNGTLNPNTGLAQSNTLTPNGNVNIQRDKFGNITSLTYNGKTFTGDAARQRYQWLQSTGTISGRK